MSVNISHLLERIDDEFVREAIKAIVDQVVTGEDVRNYITGTTFGFKESTNEAGGREVRLEPLLPSAEAVNFPTDDLIPGG